MVKALLTKDLVGVSQIPFEPLWLILQPEQNEFYNLIQELSWTNFIAV
jgi:hypothetical protein